MLKMRKIKKVLASAMLLCLLTATGVTASAISIKGIVQQTDQGFVIITEDGQSLLVSGQDLSKLVGQKIQATGNISEEMGVKTIVVEKIGPAEK